MEPVATDPTGPEDEHWTGRHGKPIIFVILTLAGHASLWAAIIHGNFTVH